MSYYSYRTHKRWYCTRKPKGQHPMQTVYTVEVFERDGVFVFAAEEDAARFEAAINAANDGWSACIRRPQVVCDRRMTDVLLQDLSNR